MVETFIYMYSVMPGMFPYLIFRFKVAMAANSKMAAIGLRLNEIATAEESTYQEVSIFDNQYQISIKT